MLQLYKNIKNRRLELGLTQTDLAKALGYSDKSMIAKIEKGIIDLPQTKIMSFAKALRIPPGDLMGFDGGSYEDSNIERFEKELDAAITILKNEGYTVVYSDNPKDDSIIIKDEKNNIVSCLHDYELVVKYESLCRKDSNITAIQLLGLDTESDPDIRRIERARKNMPEKEQDRMMRMLMAAFDEYFDDTE